MTKGYSQIKAEAQRDIHVMTLRLPAKAARQIERAARAADLSVNQWMRRAASEKLEREAANHRQIEDELTAMTAALEVTK